MLFENRRPDRWRHRQGGHAKLMGHKWTSGHKHRFAGGYDPPCWPWERTRPYDLPVPFCKLQLIGEIAACTLGTEPAVPFPDAREATNCELPHPSAFLVTNQCRAGNAKLEEYACITRACISSRRGDTLKEMPEVLVTHTLPLDMGSDGVIRVGGTRVTLDTIWAAFQDGATAEEIVQEYPSLSLADAYQAIGYCLRNRSLVDTYLVDRRDIAEETRTLNESRWSPAGIRARLLERRR